MLHVRQEYESFQNIRFSPLGFRWVHGLCLSPRFLELLSDYEGCSKSFANRYTENIQSIGI